MPAPVPIPDAGTQQLLDQAYSDARTQLKGQVPDSLLHGVPRNPAPDRTSSSTSLSWQNNPNTAPLPTADAPPEGAMPYGADVESTPPQGAEPVRETPKGLTGFWDSLYNNVSKGLNEGAKGLWNLGVGVTARAAKNTAISEGGLSPEEAGEGADKFADTFFKAVSDGFDPAIKHYQDQLEQDAAAGKTSRASQILGGVAGGAAPLAFGPEGFLASSAMNAGTDSVDANQDLRTTYALVGVNLLANAAGMKVPFKSPNVIKRVLANGTFSAGVGAASQWLARKFLQSGGYQEAADKIDPLDPTSLGTSGLLGAIFGFLEKPGNLNKFKDLGGHVPSDSVDVGDVGDQPPGEGPPPGAEPVTWAGGGKTSEGAPVTPVDINSPGKGHGMKGRIATPGESLEPTIPDQPSAEPVGDLKAQITDMKDPGTARKAVYLSKDNVAELGDEGVADLAKGSKQIRNFDKKGGVLIVPDVATAKEARTLRESEPDMQKVLGQLTGAGDGKAPDDTMVVQGKTPDGAVATEGTVRPDEVASKTAEVVAEGKTPVVTTPEEAIARRAEGVGAEKAQAPEVPPAGAEPVVEAVPVDLNKPSAEPSAKKAAPSVERKVANKVSSESRQEGESTERPARGAPKADSESPPPESKSELAKAMDTLTEQNAKPKGKAFAKPLGARGEDTATAGLVLKAAAKEAKAKGTAGDDAIDRANKAANNAIKLGGKSEEVIKKSQGISHKRIDAINEEMQRAARVLEGRGKPEDEEVVTPRRRQLEAQVEKFKAKKAAAAGVRPEPAKEAPVARPEPATASAKPAAEPAPKSPEKQEIAVKPYPIKGREDEAIAAFTGINPKQLLNRTPASARPHVMALLQELHQGADSEKGWLGHMFMLDRDRNDEGVLNRGQWIQLRGRIERYAKAAPAELESVRHNLETHMNDIEGKRLDDRTQQAVHDYAEYRRREEILRRTLSGKPEPEPVHDEEVVDDRAGQTRDRGADEDETPEDRDVSAEVDAADDRYEPAEHESQASLTHRLWGAVGRHLDQAWGDQGSPFRAGDTVQLHDLLDSAIKHMPFGPTRAVMQNLRRYVDNVNVRMVDQVIGRNGPRNSLGLYSRTPDGRHDIQVRVGDTGTSMRTVLHEAVHAATVDFMKQNPTHEFSLEVQDLLNVARNRARLMYGRPTVDSHIRYFQDTALQPRPAEVSAHLYGLTDKFEFLSEALTNTEFQKFLVDSERVSAGEGAIRPIISRLAQAIRKLFGVPETGGARQLFDSVLNLSGEIMRAQYEDAHFPEGNELLEHALEQEPPRLHNEDERFRGVTESMKPVTRAFSHAFKSGAWQTVRNTVLSTMPTDHMFRRYAAAFGAKEDPTNPVHRYAEVNAQKQTVQNKMLERAQPVAEKWMKLTDAQNRRVGQFMIDSTRWGIDPTKAAADHNVTTQGQRNFAARYAHFQERWNAMSPAEKDAYTSVRDINDYAIREHRKVAVDVALKSFEDELTDGQRQRLHDVRNPKEYDGLIGDDKEIDLPGLNDKLKERLHDVAGLAEIEGPYFHLGRDGDFVVQATPEGSREFGTKAEAEAFANTVKELGPSSKATVAERGGKHVVDYRAHYVSMHNSADEAEVDAQRMRDAGFEVPAVTRKTLSESGTPLTPALRELVAESERKISSHGKTDESEALTQAMRSAFVHLIASRSAYAGSKLARKGVAGVKPEEMRMAFGRHLQSLSWHTSNLATVFDEAQALAKLREASRKPEVGNATQATMYHRGEFVTELSKRVQQDVQNNGVHSKWNATIAKVGFLNFLASPAHAAIWLTQNFTTGIPVLGARYGYGKTSRLFIRAMTNKAMFQGMRTALAGVIRPDKMGDITSSDITRAILTAVRAHPDFAKWAQGDNSHIQQLLERGAIGSSYSNELGLIARGEAQWSAKGMEYARLLPHMADAVNRVSTALVGLELTKGNIAKTADMIREIHVDYSYGNRPRAFKALPRGMSSIFMMKTYVTNMAHLFYGHAYDLATKQGADRATAIKTAAGMMAGAALFTGITGAIPEPVKWMAYAFNGMFGDDKYFDFDNSIRRWASDAMGKEAGAVASSGLPRLLGMDVSNRMGLSNLFFHEPPDLRSLTKDKAMQFLGSFLGPVPQMVIEHISDAMKHFQAGEITQGMLSLVPAKPLHDAQKAYDLAEEGKKNGAGAQLLKPSDLGTSAIVNQALGFKPGVIADVQSRQSTAFGYKDWASANRSRLVSDYLSRPPAERKDVMSRITKWNAANPGQRITVSELIKHERSGARAGQLARGEQTRDPEVNRLLKY